MQNRRAFSLMELLAAIAIVAMLAALLTGASSQALARAKRTDSIARLRSVGQAIHLYANDHDQQLPGPLWPGQVMLYDPDREGRIVRELAAYLDIEERPEPYLVERMIPLAYRSGLPEIKKEDLRVYLMNPSVTVDGQSLAPFGSLTSTPAEPPLRLPRLLDLPEEDQRWMACEADQMQPYVATAAWKANTPATPVHSGHRATLAFDGSVTLKATQ